MYSHEQLTKMVAENTVVIFGKGEKHQPRCGFTAGVQAIFDEFFPEYIMINVLGDRKFQETLCQFSDWPTFPQVYVYGEFIGGHDITVEMADEGELKKLIDSSKE